MNDVIKYEVVLSWFPRHVTELLADRVVENDKSLKFYMDNELNMSFNNNGGWLAYYPLE